MSEPDMEVVAFLVNAYRSGKIGDQEFLQRLVDKAGFRLETAAGLLRYEQSCADAAPAKSRRGAPTAGAGPPKTVENAEDRSGWQVIWLIALAVVLILVFQ